MKKIFFILIILVLEYQGGICVNNENVLPLRGIDLVDEGELKGIFKEFFKVSFMI